MSFSEKLSTDVEVRTSIPADAVDLAPRLRGECEAEVRAVGFSPLAALTGVFNWPDHETYSVVIEGRVEAMFGTIPVPGDPGSATIWLLMSEVPLKKIRRLFIRQSERYCDLIAKRYAYVYNHVPQEHGQTVRWLSWLGFEFDFEEMRTFSGLNFVPFVRCQGAGSDVYSEDTRPVEH